ncbi:MAG: heavy-metal-associated domain-containing protein [Ardenticatenaceae bacterium]|nr:heavy-metal-associated domain-containing protein [Ardenticatenaceae bacterium]
MKTRSITLPIGARSCCSAGARIVERALVKVPGVVQVEANAATSTACIEYDPALVDPDQLRAAVDGTGFGPARRRRNRQVDGGTAMRQDRRALRRAFVVVGAVIVWVVIIAATGMILRGTTYFGHMLPLVGGGAVYFVVLAPGFLFRGR